MDNSNSSSNNNSKSREEVKKSVIVRLNKVEGQIKGLQKMIEKDENCKDILVQIGAVRSAITKVGAIMVETCAKECSLSLNNSSKMDPKIDELVSALLMLLK